MANSKTLEQLRKQNPGIKIQDCSAPAFLKYGRILKGFKPAKAVAYAKKQACINDPIVYEPSVKGLEADTTFLKAVADSVFGGMPVQIGWCYGRNSTLDGLEYHKGIEVVVAVTDCVVLLGDQRDIITGKDGARYTAAKAEAFYCPAGTIVEFHCWCLHFAPIHVKTKTGFLTLVVLPRDTNTPIKKNPRAKGEEALLFARNKWLLVHKSATGLIKMGAAVGITGTNTRIHPAG